MLHRGRRLQGSRLFRRLFKIFIGKKANILLTLHSISDTINSTSSLKPPKKFLKCSTHVFVIFFIFMKTLVHDDTTTELYAYRYYGNGNICLAFYGLTSDKTKTQGVVTLYEHDMEDFGNIITEHFTGSDLDDISDKILKYLETKNYTFVKKH